MFPQIRTEMLGQQRFIVVMEQKKNAGMVAE